MRLAFAAALLCALCAACGGSAGGSQITIVPNGDGTPTPAAPANTLAPGETPPPTETPSPGSTPTSTSWAEPLPCNDILVPIGKDLALAPDCAPGERVRVPAEYIWTPGHEVTPATLEALIEFLDAAAADGFEMFVQSSYRSYDVQVDTFQHWVNVYGSEEAASRISARPGHSEHQLGTTVDLTIARNGTDLDSFVGTPEAAWVAENAVRFGFVVSYPEGMEDVTGYVWEPWHIRYVGTGVASAIEDSGVTPGEWLLSR